MSDDVIAIVGKNGSGKSNIIRALSGLQFFSLENHNTLSDFNAFCRTGATPPDVEISFVISMQPEDYQDIVPESLRNGLHDEKIRLVFFRYNSWGFFMRFQSDTEETDKTPCIFTKILNADEKLVDYFSLLQRALKNDTNSPNNNDRDIHAGILYWSEHWDHLHSWSDYNWIRNHYHNVISNDKIRYIEERYNAKMKEFGAILPKIFIYDDCYFSDVYTRDELTKDNQQYFKKPSALKYLLDATNMPVGEFMQAFGNPENCQCATTRHTILRRVDSFSRKFNNFYNKNKEQIKLSPDFDNGRFLLFVESDNNEQIFKISERSNGLKWYLTFYAALCSAQAQNNALILIDEPAVHLHVDAQKEVLSLFNSLVESKLQIIYTTHSPAMLDTNSWERIRLVEKKDNISHIYGIQASHEGVKQLETLTPVQQAMGCCLKNTLTPDANRCNIITEGITDYYYLKAMLKILKIPEDRCYIIPACGANNVPNTLSILFGWGYKVKALLDNDKEGQNVADKIKKAFPEDYDTIVTMVSSQVGDSIENLFDPGDLEHFRIKSQDPASCKVPTALSFMKNASTLEYSISETTKKKFHTLFVRLGILP